ncbi:hypothetical protein DVW05_11780 [Clostridium botulinum]|uniref:hypothetical protein n=1 Tax=unclassified Clostridium TaxID=2614128 RepID=UPI0013C67666|nr:MULTISPECIES: hypothetical protein [unclassified Clostridium]MBN1056024.1 hypothetical protein [Clostridium botulinum]NFI93877.1 hypothetical protein [Clostridium botulinum]NFO91338.1 hypothetical protein [Clostridium botulinum]
MITCECKYKKEEFKKTLYLYYKTTKQYINQIKKARKFLFILLIWLGINIFLRIIDFSNLSRIQFGVLIVIGVIFCVLVHMMIFTTKYYSKFVIWKINKFCNKNNNFFNNKLRFSVNEDGSFLLENANGNTHNFQMSSLVEVLNVNQNYVLALKNSFFICIPFDSFKNEEEKNRFKKQLNIT